MGLFLVIHSNNIIVSPVTILSAENSGNLPRWGSSQCFPRPL